MRKKHQKSSQHKIIKDTKKTLRSREEYVKKFQEDVKKLRKKIYNQ